MHQSRPGEPRFEDLTEAAGVPIADEAASMMSTRYAWAAEIAPGRRVLELACGSGPGLGLLAARATWLAGADYSAALLARARDHYGTRVPLVRLSADALPFASGSFDLVLLFEASYYVPNMGEAFREIARVLSPGGRALFVNANPDRADFIPSPHSVEYHNADGFRMALRECGFDVGIEGAFPIDVADTHGFWSTLVPHARNLLQALRLVPRTLRGRARIKKLLGKRLRDAPAELREGFAPIEPRGRVAVGRVEGFKVIYVAATKRPEHAPV